MSKFKWLVYSVVLVGFLVVLYNKTSPADYNRLQEVLKAKEWQQADLETTIIIIKVSGREWMGWWNWFHWPDSFKKFSCEDLRIIDQLWVKYSEGHFGFSVQQHIWESIPQKNDSDPYKIFEIFANRVGWLTNDSSKLLFTLDAPQGELPSFEWMQKATPGGSSWPDSGVDLFSRVKTCGI